MPNSAQLRNVVASYAAAVSAGDADAYAELFTVDAVQVDPYPTTRNEGREAIRAFVKNSFVAVEAMELEVSDVHPAGDKVAFNFHATIHIAGAPVTHMRGAEVFTVNDDGLVSAVEAYWSDEDRTAE